MEILFMLPARSGSKGVPDKNIKDLCGKPLMAYTIEALIKSETYQKHDCYIMLNTDSKVYAKIGEIYGAKAPFLRPKELSEDNTIIDDVISHTVQYFEKQGRQFGLFALIQVTSPFLQCADVDHAINLFEENPFIDTAISVTESEIMPLWCNTLDSDKNMKDFIREESRRKNRQELPQYYRVTGSFRIIRWDKICNHSIDWYSGNSKAVIVAQENSIDIDTPLDFEFAEFLMKKRRP